MLYQQFHNAADADLFFVGEAFKPFGKLVGALNLPRHSLNMLLNELCVKSYIGPTERQWLHFFTESLMTTRSRLAAEIVCR